MITRLRLTRRAYGRGVCAVGDLPRYKRPAHNDALEHVLVLILVLRLVGVRGGHLREHLVCLLGSRGNVPQRRHDNLVRSRRNHVRID